jgi:predicted nucleic acid-binding protein
MVILDTNIIIDHLRMNSNTAQSKLITLVTKHPQESLALSLISIQELYEGQSTLIASKEKELLATIAPLKIIPYTYQTAMLAGQIARDLHHPIQFADAAIAATSMIANAELYTLNLRDFESIPGLALFTL